MLGNEDCAASLTSSPRATEQAHINETAKPLAFTFVPTVRRLPIHIQIIDTTRFSPQPGKQQNPGANSSLMNEPLHITEEMASADVTNKEAIGQRAPRHHTKISQSWLNDEGGYVSAEEAASLQGIFKAELVFLADSDGTDGDCFSRENGAAVNLTAKKLPLLTSSPNPFADDNSSSVPAKVLAGGSKVPLLQDAEREVDGALQEPLFQAIDEAISDYEKIPPGLTESAAHNASEETHSQFLFESESLRRRSEELYATIQQVLEDPLPMRCSSSTPNSLQKLLDSEAHKPVSPIPKSAGRETKYANLHLPVSESTGRRPTRPGVIRPVTIVPKTPATPETEEICPNPFMQHPEESSDAEIKEWLFPLSTILTSVSYPSMCHETYQTMLCSQDMSQSIPLSLSPVTCLTSGSYIRFSPILPCNYYMTSNLSRSLHSLYIKPRHSITTIHENEALGITELVDVTTKLKRDQRQNKGTEKGSERSPLQNTNYHKEALVILEEE
ncbi:uncharacterized protein mlip isoform X8 [Heptranchias perlo]|uniref:uncharacterized protein mlip isoform X8 n=1 Tax=Heptranchias perlo TaxID=212740 RepID=UPI0035597E5B